MDHINNHEERKRNWLIKDAMYEMEILIMRHEIQSSLLRLINEIAITAKNENDYELAILYTNSS